MPRVEDIAWKFVIRQGRKWRCPYCKNEYSGSVVRVKSHLLKLAKVGITSCTKVPEHIRTLMESLHNHEVCNKDDIAWKFVNRLGKNKWHCYHCREEFIGDLTGVKSHLLGVPKEGISICMEVPDHIRMLMQSLLDEVAEEESREVKRQFSTEPQSFDMLTQAEVVEEESREANNQSSMEPKSHEMPTQAGVAEEESRETNSQFPMEPCSRDMLHPAGPLSSFDLIEQFSTKPEGAPAMAKVTSDQQRGEHQFQQSVTMSSLAHNSHGESSTMASTEEVLYPANLRSQPQCSFQYQMQMTDQQTPAGASSFQDDQLPTVDNSNCLQDCNQNSQLQTSMDIDLSIAPQHTIKSQVVEARIIDSPVQEMATNTTRPSSSEGMNRCSPIMNEWSIYAKDEEIRNLERKVEEPVNKEAVIKKQMEIESAAFSAWKKPRIPVQKWLKETLPQTLVKEVRDAKGFEFFERKLSGKAIHRNIELIWEHLTKNHACKLGIYGMGGVGKTAIMMHIHNRLLRDASFDDVVFITVSQDFSIYKLQSDIWKALKFGVMEDEHEKKRAAMLLKQLERKKNCVLILDDVWERLDLEEVGIPIKADGFKLVLTTRSFDVCCQMHCQEKIKIKPLSQKEAKSLFFEEHGSKVLLNFKIKAIVKSIVRECAGLPIGIIRMARSMRGATAVFEWRDSLVKLKESSMGQTDMKVVLMILKFSYDRLGIPEVQQCFLSCALYPQGKLIDKFKLIEFFIDQGLMGGLSTRREQYDRGLAILNRLGNVCLLEDHGREMKMHNMIRNMALHIMSATSIVKARQGLTRIPLEEYWTDALEKVSLMENEISEIPLNMSPNCPKLSTLLLDYGLSRDAVIPDSFFEKLWGLKVLNLSGNNMTELPSSISDLVNLRALLLRECMELRRIPYLGKLTSLRKLDCSGCGSLQALEGLEKLVNLRYLDLTKTRIDRLPKGTLERLLNLQLLKVTAVNEDVTKLGALETFTCYLENVDDFNKCVKVIEQSNNPHYYYLNVGLGEPKFLVEVSDDALFGNRRSVTILEWCHAIVSMGSECTGIFILIPRDVQTMTMRKCNGITTLSGMGLLEYLKELEIIYWENLEVLYGGHAERVIDIQDSPVAAPTPLFPRLRVLNIDGCPKLKYLFGHGSKSNLPHLQKIQINDCKEMVGIIAAVTSPPPHPLPFFPSLEQISISCCNKMKRAVEFEWMPHFPNLREIAVLKCEKMEEIIGSPTPYLPVEGISLESLTVGYCDNMRKLFSLEWLLHLRNLQCIKVSFCKEMVEMISGAGQGQEGSIMTPVNNTPSSFQPSSISLPKLEWLELFNLPQLKSVCEVPISYNSTMHFLVYDCPSLEANPL